MSPRKQTDEQELLKIRETIIVAVASDESLMERLTLKGGNALDIVYRLSERSSLDLDFSMQGDFDSDADIEDTKQRLFSALRERFDAIGYVVFDAKFESRPRGRGGPGVVWGGYNALFKLIRRARFLELGGAIGTAPSDAVLAAMQRESQVTGIGAQRVFTIEISKFEHVEGKQVVEVAGFDCYVYTPSMIAIEKLRAICQQSPNYKLRRNPAPRPRDFFDIHTIATRANCDLAAPEHHELVKAMFSAKDVDLALIREIGSAGQREFHAQQWPAVVDAIRGGAPEEFDYYYEFVVREGLRLLKALEQDAKDSPYRSLG